ncbi:DUF4440 domain-containing protein [Geodermatophilus pulveris]|uniref:DUF4440 domain-containing protein n=1 Tax=Geodermatophilus pulveris TaxID=1564159 RepID=UPI001179C3D2|nr:DUF4440 domain-containing protein [Geodermatophilus pulveris]
MDEELAEVVRLEWLLLEPHVRNDPQQLLSLLHEDFHEYGASGRVWQRDSVAQATSGTQQAIAATHVGARRLGPDAALLTYRTE